ncbi:Sporulation and spore germination [Actinacidiphila yanglinensis]|uniref:Sporulation and spore germination n=1 Tax=Actinacidiphila yanglinensis TaxID=310779 RepID=A0A1H6BN15_9ACTN|nr:GerMN domain-containing protein [Actinacidiphila yanglinensis]SEG61797.1 Sporulation and spore germination [Actinacidiphila yanglinensis]
MTGWRAGAAVAAAGAAAVLLAGCGVPTTGVVDVGVPASGLPAPERRSSLVPVYFLDGDNLRPIVRDVPPGADPVTAAVELLFAGPPKPGGELTTRLPRPPVAVAVHTEGQTVTVRLPGGRPAPDTLAMRQVACTAAGALGSPKAVAVSGGAAPTAAGGGASSSAVRIEVVGSGWQRDVTDPACPSLPAPPSAPAAPPVTGPPSAQAPLS